MSVQGVTRSDVCTRIESLDKETCMEWGGVWDEETETARVQPLPLEDSPYIEPTRVESVADANLAFDKYTQFFEYVLNNHAPENDEVVLLPCGSNKPIGSSSIHKKKLNALDEAGYMERCDIAIVSEPCTIIPHEMRLSRPAVNYDFPPEFTEASRAPEVFDVFTTRLAEWLDVTPYSRAYAYLVEGHMNKLRAAHTKATSPPEIVVLPGASLNSETENYSGDLFKSTSDVATKLAAIHSLVSDVETGTSSSMKEFYREKYHSL